MVLNSLQECNQHCVYGGFEAYYGGTLGSSVGDKASGALS
jgi:hypothetical protein